MSLARYRWSSLVIESRAALPELRRCDSAKPDVRFTCRADGQLPRSWRWSHRWVLGNARWLSIARTPDGHVLRFERLADFVVSADLRTIACRAARTTRPQTIRHLFLDQVLPAITPDERRFGLHASAVAIDGSAVAFLGRAGGGKSTLAASLGLQGAPIVTDDCLLLDLSRAPVAAVPTYPSLRLSREALRALGAEGGPSAHVAQYSAKRRLGLDNIAGLRFRRRPLPVGRLYVLERVRSSLQPRIVPLSRRQAYIELMKFSFRLDPRDPAALMRECDRLTRIAQTVPVALLRVPSNLGALTDVRSALMADIRSVNGR